MEDLTADLAAFDEAPIDTSAPSPTLDGAPQADRFLRRLQLNAMEMAEVERIAYEETERIARWKADRQRTLTAAVRWLETSLEQFMRAHHAATKAVTLKLPHGELKLRPRTASIVVDDGEAFVRWAEANKLTVTLTRLPDPPGRKPDASAIKQVTVIDKPVDVPEGTPTFILGAGATDEHHEGKLLHPVMLGDEIVPGVRVALAPDERVFGASLAD